MAEAKDDIKTEPEVQEIIKPDEEGLYAFTQNFRNGASDITRGTIGFIQRYFFMKANIYLEPTILTSSRILQKNSTRN